MTDDPFDNIDFPWPEKGDKLFSSAEDSWHNACLNYASSDWEQYIMGYKKAGDLLVANVKETNIWQDVLVYPIVFLYRQYIELRLKNLIGTGIELLNEDRSFPKNHRLDILWSDFRSMLPKIEKTTKKADLEAMDDLILEFSKMDPISMSFRYPITKDGEKTLSNEITHINLRQLSDVMDKIGSYLNSAADMFSVYLGYKHDMESEFRDYHDY